MEYHDVICADRTPNIFDSAANGSAFIPVLFERIYNFFHATFPLLIVFVWFCLFLYLSFGNAALTAFV